jgi:thioredoxin 1
MSFFKRKQAPSAPTKDSVVNLSEAEFDESINRNEIVMVMFCKPECPHCMRMEPIYQELSEEMVDRVLCGRVNILTNVGLWKKYKVTGTPTFVLIQHGAVVGTVIGECTKERLKDEMVRHLQ